MLILINGGGRADKNKSENPFLVFYSKFIKEGFELVVLGDNDFNKKSEEEFKRHFKKGVRLKFINPANKIFQDEDKIVEALKRAGGIYIAGGDTLKYYNYYTSNRAIKSVIQNAALKGVPVAGSSAGSILLSSLCCVVGGYYIERSNRYSLNANTIETKKAHNNKKILIKDGLNIIKDRIIDVHLTSYGRLPRLIEIVKRTNLQGVGLDENTFLLYNKRACKVLGEGRVFVVNSCGKNKFNVSIYKEGDHFF